MNWTDPPPKPMLYMNGTKDAPPPRAAGPPRLGVGLPEPGGTPLFPGACEPRLREGQPARRAPRFPLSRPPASRGDDGPQCGLHRPNRDGPRRWEVRAHDAALRRGYRPDPPARGPSHQRERACGGRPKRPAGLTTTPPRRPAPSTFTSPPCARRSSGTPRTPSTSARCIGWATALGPDLHFCILRGGKECPSGLWFAVPFTCSLSRP